MVEQCGIYAITSPSGKAYIGSSVRLAKRRTRHFYELQIALSDETKSKISAATMGRLKSDVTKARMRKPKSPEHSAAISAGKRGKGAVFTPEGLEVRRAMMVKVHAALASKRQARKVAAHMDMLNWMIG